MELIMEQWASSCSFGSVHRMSWHCPSCLLSQKENMGCSLLSWVFHSWVCFALDPLEGMGVGHKVALIRLVVGSLCWGWFIGLNLLLFKAAAMTLPSLDGTLESKPAVKGIKGMAVTLCSLMIVVPIDLWLTGLGREGTSVVGKVKIKLSVPSSRFFAWMHRRAECLEETDSLFTDAFDCYLSGPQETSQFSDWEWVREKHSWKVSAVYYTGKRMIEVEYAFALLFWKMTRTDEGKSEKICPISLAWRGDTIKGVGSSANRSSLAQ